MSPRPRLRASRQATVALCLMSACAAVAVLFAASAQAAQYKMVTCAGSAGAAPYKTETNTKHSGNPGGIFDLHNWCDREGGDPPGSASHLRIQENQGSGNAGHGAYGRFVFASPSHVHFKAAGGYTRQAHHFNEGWRSRFWAVDFANRGVELITQGAGLPNSGTRRPRSSTFGPHLWPFNYHLDFHTFVFEMLCVRSVGCDRSGFNSTDANGFVFQLIDTSDSKVSFTDTGSDLMSGRWVRGTQTVRWQASDQGSGLRRERLRLDGATQHTEDHPCDVQHTQSNGESARSYSPCPTGGPWGRDRELDTSAFPDGSHTVQLCTQDYAQYQGLNGTTDESCTQRSLRFDNTPPDAPLGLHVVSEAPGRYLPSVGARFSLPENHGSPIAKVHYEVIDAGGEVVVPRKTLEGTDPVALEDVRGPAQHGDYRLRVWLEDGVGLSGPPATAQIPHDTTPPAAPQQVSVTPPERPRTGEGFDVRWHNIVDNGSPIDRVHYEVRDSGGDVVVSTKTLRGQNPEAIENLDAPRGRGSYELSLWLSDAEGNVGAPVAAPLSYRCERSRMSDGLTLSAGLGSEGKEEQIVAQDQGTTLSGRLHAAGGGAGEASICVFSRVVTDASREFEGIAMTGSGGGYSFATGAGPSREFEVLYRSGHRRISADATLLARVEPVFEVRERVVRNKRFARFYGRIPGPHNDNVVIVLQVRQGNGWLAFRRVRTRNGGRFTVGYRFNRATKPSRYVMRAQVRQQVGYPYLQGNSRHLRILALPARKYSRQARLRAARVRAAKRKAARRQAKRKAIRRTARRKAIKRAQRRRAIRRARRR